MLNQVILVGRLTNDPKLEKLESGKTICKITLACPRSYKNSEGCYDTDFIDCLLQFGTAETTCEYCKKGDLLGIKGRIETNLYETDNGTKGKATEIIVEKATFLSSRKENN